MSDQPPSSGRPTGPPSGPLSGPSPSGPTPPPPTVSGAPPGPPSGGDHGGPLGPGGSGGSGDGRGGPGDSGGPGSGSGAGSGGGSGAAPGSGPGRPWWRSAPRIAAITTAVVVAVVLVVFLTRPDDSGGTKAGGGEVFLQAAGSSGPDPFTESTARKSETEPGTASPSAVPSASATGSQVTRGVDGAEPGLYGGTRKVASCDVEKQISTLRAAPDKNRAFASVQDIEPSAVPDYLRSLTPVQLRMDTRVTNHGFRDGKATAYQAVLQAGTAVLVDDRGVPRVRCACGNPLLPPVAQKSTPEQKGKAWPGYRASDVVVVQPASKPVDEFVMVDPSNGDWFTRPAGDTGGGDKKTDPPKDKDKDKEKDESDSPCPPGSGDNDSCRPSQGESPAEDGSPPPGDSPPPADDGTTAPPPDNPTSSEPPPPGDSSGSQPAPPQEQQPQEQQPQEQQPNS
ncbi:hypothetical protein GTY67_01615 [Streptomyces sp. SID8374]|uniref:DUF6777 domain-containing protein n=1 Tax=Streptomyces sp. SID8374 TaxID=2690354 RepID=UPI0013699934|nr:DUF6777 domain-containing protein [Streptomyces sp. SID8374]MYX12128.1 hypothetical protein [Streptomyces sp. SID8374]